MNEQELANLHKEWQEELKKYRVGYSDEEKEAITEYAKIARTQTKEGVVPWSVLVKKIEERFGYKVPTRTVGTWVSEY